MDRIYTMMIILLCIMFVDSDTLLGILMVLFKCTKNTAISPIGVTKAVTYVVIQLERSMIIAL